MIIRDKVERPKWRFPVVKRLGFRKNKSISKVVANHLANPKRHGAGPFRRAFIFPFAAVIYTFNILSIGAALNWFKDNKCRAFRSCDYGAHSF